MPEHVFLAARPVMVAAPSLGQVLVGNVQGVWSPQLLGTLSGSFGTPASLTAALTPLTVGAPGTPDYAIQALVQNTGFGFVTADEGQTVLTVIANVQARLAQVEAKLTALGITI